MGDTGLEPVTPSVSRRTGPLPKEPRTTFRLSHYTRLDGFATRCKALQICSEYRGITTVDEEQNGRLPAWVFADCLIRSGKWLRRSKALDQRADLGLLAGCRELPRQGGRPTSESENVRHTLRFVRRSYDKSPVVDFGRVVLKSNQTLIETGSPWATINTGDWDPFGTIASGAVPTRGKVLGQRSMRDEVAAYYAEEFGRTPLMNSHAGRDHLTNDFAQLLGQGSWSVGRRMGRRTTRTR
jgi:hypothetical protein